MTVALGALAKGALGPRPAVTVTGITGSSGKTSTKDLTAQVVEHLGPIMPASPPAVSHPLLAVANFLHLQSLNLG